MTDTAQAQVRPSGDDTPRGQTDARVRRRVRAGAGDGRRRKRIWTYGLLLLSAGLMVNALIGEKGYLANLQARQEFQDVSESLRQLKAENARLEEDARRMRTDPRALEDAARSQLGLVKPGETLITLRDRPATRD
jgi:cell division protein FtsB